MSFGAHEKGFAHGGEELGMVTSVRVLAPEPEGAGDALDGEASPPATGDFEQRAIAVGEEGDDFIELAFDMLHGGQPVGEAKRTVEGELVYKAGVYELNEA